MTMTERKVIKAEVGLLELAKQLGSVTQNGSRRHPRVGDVQKHAPPFYCQDKGRSQRV